MKILSHFIVTNYLPQTNTSHRARKGRIVSSFTKNSELLEVFDVLNRYHHLKKVVRSTVDKITNILGLLLKF